MVFTKLLSLWLKVCYGRPAEILEENATALILMADGCGGIDLCERALMYVVGQTEPARLVRAVHWGHGFGHWHADLTDVANQARWSRSVADQVLAWRVDHPRAPVCLVGKSGGTGIMVGALELLPEGSVETVVLMASALSPRYDLSRALRAVIGEAVAFWSPLDVIILGAGTWLFGTIDRVRSVSAGLVGFRPPDGLDDAGLSHYRKLRQVRWRPSMVCTGYLGGHIGPDSPAFLRKYVVPLLTAEKPPIMLNLPRDQAHSTPRR